ncbi:MAG: OB-fold nucleic acid binding domain-containing protein [Gemmatimonadota bacterium]|nr:MAG: OB-fold nucleic acid binding domain-containing protein [Gemmatimonadota bacterium]
MTEQGSVPRNRSTRNTARALLGFLATAAVAAACGDAGGNNGPIITATGLVNGSVYFDANGNRQSDEGDVVLRDIIVSLVLPQVLDTVQTTRSDALGEFTFFSVPVGNYGVVVDTTTIGDSAVVALIQPDFISVTPDDTLDVSIAISFPVLTTQDARAAPLGTKVFVVGIALNDAGAFGDSTVHVADTTGTLRGIRAGPGFFAASDSVRLRGTVATRNGQPVLDLDRMVPQVLAASELPVQDTVTTAEAATAVNSTLDAALVRVDTARVSLTVTENSDLVVTVDDGSGPLDVVLDGDISFNVGDFLLPGSYIMASGLLVPTGSGTWRLKPRSASDLELIVPVMSIAAARTRPVGEIVFVDGILLNDWGTFADSTVHVSDTSASIRGVRVPRVTSASGDSVRFVGTVASRNGQKVIDGATVFFLGVAQVPVPGKVTTGVAASADAGRLDAALVRIDSARISDTVTVNQDFVITINDGSGAIDVVLDDDVGFNLDLFTVPGPVPGAYLKVTGLLVPTGMGDWQVKPRFDVDLDLTVPVITVATARARPAGEIVFTDGTMLNDWSAFGDSTAHVADATGAIRGIRVRPTLLMTGEIVRFVGTITTQNGQPVIADVAAFSLEALSPPSAVPLATAEASTARAGALDAALIRIQNCVITSTGASGGDFLMTVDDGSGPVVVVLDKDIFVAFGEYTPGVIVNVTGLLVPTGSGTWVVKPRQETDVFVVL